MANPFDQIIGIEDNQEKDRPPKKGLDKVSISFSFDKRNIERSIFLILILVLALLVAFNPFQSCDGAAVTGAVTADNNQSSDTVIEDTPDEIIIVNDSADTDAEPEADNQADQEQAGAEVEEPTPDASDLASAGSFDEGFTFAITEVNVLRDGNTPILMRTIKIAMENDWKTFAPSIKVYWYGSRSDNSTRSKIRATWIGATLPKGGEQVVTIDDFEYKGIETGSDTMRIDIYDRTANELLKSYTKTIR